MADESVVRAKLVAKTEVTKLVPLAEPQTQDEALDFYRRLDALEGAVLVLRDSPDVVVVSREVLQEAYGILVQNNGPEMWKAIGQALDATAGVVRDGVWFTKREAIVAMAAVAEAIDGWEERGGMDHDQTVTARLVMRKVAAFVSAEHRRAALATEEPEKGPEDA